MIRLGLCCKFMEVPIRFKITTAAALGRLQPKQRLEKLSLLCAHNADALHDSIGYCSEAGIGAFRINSQVLPLKTHPDHKYEVRGLPGGAAIERRFRACGRLARNRGVRLSFHPDQFVVLNSPDAGIVERSIKELEYQAQVAQWVGADVINIHGGGAYGDKKTALARLRKTLKQLPNRISTRLTLENDDRIYTPRDLQPVCKEMKIPLVYDVHHHRCLPDDWTVEEATGAALETWNREPLFHLSTPREGWKNPEPRYHHDYINPRDFPRNWLGHDLTVDVEAKAKELAVLRLNRWLKRQGVAG